MPETPSKLTEKYGASISELAQNNLYVHGTRKPNLFRTQRNNGGIIEIGLKNGVTVSEDTLARNMMYSTNVRYGGSGINGVLIFYDPPKGTLQLDKKVFPPPTTRLDTYSRDRTLGAEHIAFWLETSKSGIGKYVKDALNIMLENTGNNEDSIGEFVDGLAQLITEHARVPNISKAAKFTEENIEETHTNLDIDTATTRACEILWNSFSERLFSEISRIDFYTRELFKMMENKEEKQHLFQLLTGQQREVDTLLKKTEYVTNFIKLWKQFKDIQLPYDVLQEEVNLRMRYFRDRAIKLEIALINLLSEVEEFKTKEEKKAKSPYSKLMKIFQKGFQPK